ncbi:fasciclin domain-containing protein [Adhaeribacter swui]|uniref:Fasciclin domain-containing protein n=1 Tax=Adhaeribacter swui TaxID=2086471 RepID=A0A7G7G678_9BACT|nr:fasciclin domain-containing protein [Adhaeribacter swui]QNF32662.1 fasciclin domain-containing protein [Adhaeribacter swui]
MKRGAGLLAILILLLLFCSGTTLRAQQLLNSPISLVTPVPVNSTANELIQFANQRPLLRELLIQSGILTTLSNDKPYTFFAPTEAALQEIQYESAEKLQTIMQHHIVPGRYPLQNLKDGALLPTLAGDSVMVFRKFQAAAINSIRVNGSYETANHIVVHTIEDILKPKKLE